MFKKEKEMESGRLRLNNKEKEHSPDGFFLFYFKNVHIGEKESLFIKNE
jgi:hypothetical protein